MKVARSLFLLFASPTASFVLKPDVVQVMPRTKRPSPSHLNLSLKSDILDPVKSFLSDLSKDISNFLLNDLDDFAGDTQDALFVKDAVLKTMPLVDLDELLPTIPSGSLLICKEDTGLSHEALLLNIQGRVLVRTTLSANGQDTKPMLLDVEDYVDLLSQQEKDKVYGFGLARVHHRKDPSEDMWNLVVDFDSPIPKTPSALGHWLRTQFRKVPTNALIDIPPSMAAKEIYEQIGWISPSSGNSLATTMEWYAPNLLQRGAYMEPTEFFQWNVKPRGDTVQRSAHKAEDDSYQGKLMP
mmetsp:Transcript_18056/g.39166  ORF Transcript_18056/g.39166 Transcript_18056/m.39166 type:complete len:298 (-) Transcript_18056:977-1870(-)|eukprot:CAMPEP_0168744454 /NCGR_PEP_ID=MMETSP0724-20121128/14101_1 /TAXON_ID=265536 /ORGANISM="Amphiprora sp., Strain CCMP467" /LENGTH=297 /DNA_ID=CAMNT_0008792117 /DNA_START=99 /DNA_END=992 /DNA_ORIENTATION=+